MNIVVLGPGAIGSLWASHLYSSGHSVSVWSRHSSPTMSLQLEENPPVYFNNNSLDALSRADLLLVTLKAPQVVSSLQSLVGKLASETIIVLMHNGMGTAEQIAQRFANNPLIVATTTHGALRESQGKVRHTGHGNTELGGYNQAGKRCSFVAEVFQHSLPQAKWNPDILSALWNKLAINCAINPLSAIHQVPNGSLAEPQHAATLQAVIREVTLVMQAEGLSTNEEQLTHSVAKVIQATAKNLSSMNQDIVHQRQSEIDFITGYLIETAQKHGIATPVNLELYQAVKNIEQGWKQS
ncbi:2-dehydropantoate 2-reductase [Vibrio sinaloensis]|uniref:2-dehydropantoate 2-reductase n=1 Tax=Photobacterium sp. (strain ATCC 43367) TaxID=379097 RepID=UPI00204A7305|nr:2-dehydropantoate 2-reductase [Vibrio sinaloensis]UPQ89236.1 2-dehydropantoate 2-reductase [Vibrio sinaloensis]